MGPSLPSVVPLLITIVLATLAVGLPILVVLSIRFLWDRNLNLGRSKELEKLIWQLHRIASAMENQINSSLPAAQPAAAMPRDPASPQQLSAQPAATTRIVPASAATGAPATPSARVEQTVTPPPATQNASAPSSTSRESPAEKPQHAGVNSMFGF